MTEPRKLRPGWALLGGLFSRASEKVAAPICPPSIFFKFAQEKQPGHGEDAEPLIITISDSSQALLSVFDGLGGAGATSYEIANVRYTGAYIASRLAQETLSKVFTPGVISSRLLDIRTGNINELAQNLQCHLQESFTARAAELTPATTPLSGRLVRRLPTTIATLLIDISPRDVYCAALWAGDSRGYLLTHSIGLQQLTSDNLTMPNDALQNLTEDAPISNCVNADDHFTIHAALQSNSLPCICLVATDGCFGFLPTPAHFEHLLLKTLLEASDISEWSNSLLHYLSEVAGDDVSLAAAVIGYDSFAHVQKSFASRFVTLSAEWIEPFDAAEGRLQQVQKKFMAIEEDERRATSDRNAVRERLWRSYRRTYEARLVKSIGEDTQI